MQQTSHATDSARAHEQKIARIAHALKSHTNGKPLSLRKKAPPHQVPKAQDLRRDDHKIDLSDLDQILSIDVAKRICVAEPGVTYVDLVEATLAHGLVPIIVPELKTITIGGAVAGCSLESMSFRHGGFHDTCLEYEVITTTGEVLHCTPDNEHQLVFQMIHGSFGTLGVLTKLTFKLVPAKKYVKMTYEKYTTLAEYQAATLRHAKDDTLDYMDGIIHSQTLYVLSLGRFVDTAPYTHAYDWTRIYWKSTAERSEDYLRTADYFFRYDRGVTNVRPKSFLMRVLFGKLLGSTNILRIANAMPWIMWLDRKNPTMTLDVFLPFSNLPKLFDWYNKEINFYPLWYVPYKKVRNYEWIADQFLEGVKDEMFCDIAIYGLPPSPTKNYHRLMEAALRELRGIKTLIAHNYYTRDEFWFTWNKGNWEAVKAKVDPQNKMRGLYEKTCQAAMGVSEKAQ